MTFSNFLTTMAQVSFVLLGLIPIAVAGSRESRRYWLFGSNRYWFIVDSLLLLFMAGTASLGSLIPPLAGSTIPAWPLACAVVALFCGILALYFRKRPDPEVAETPTPQWMLGYFRGVRTDVWVFALFLLGLSAVGYYGYYMGEKNLAMEAETFLSVSIALMVGFGVMAFIASVATAGMADLPLQPLNPVENKRSMNLSNVMAAIPLLGAIILVCGALFFAGRSKRRHP